MTTDVQHPLVQQEETPQENFAPVNILIVDDLPEKHVVYKAILEPLGQNLIFAQSGQEALMQILQKEFAVILLDVNMPGMNGFETANLIRGRRKSARTPIIFLTAFTDDMHAAQGYASGAVDYLPTPVVPEVLRTKVRVFIELSQMRQQAARQAEERVRRTAAEDAARRAGYLLHVSETLARCRGVQETLEALSVMPVPALGDASFVVLADNGDETPIACCFSNGPREVPGDCSVRLSDVPWLDSLFQGVMKTRETNIVYGLENTSVAMADGTHVFSSALAVPLLIKEKVYAVLVLAKKDKNANWDDLPLAASLASRVSIVLENAMLIQRIQDADRRKDEFLAILAHELRNPLAPVSNALQVMRMIAPDDQRLIDIADIMQRQIQHMNRLVDDLLDVSRITEGRIELKKETLSFNNLMQNAVESCMPMIIQSRHKISVSLPDAPVYLYGDNTRLTQIFSNILNNAAKYTPPGGMIYVEGKADGKILTVSIRDTGKGIPEHMLPRIFDMFTQVDSSMERSQGGLGIGLKLVKELCEMHGGTVDVRSEGLGKGSEFIIRLPVVKNGHTMKSPDTPVKDAGETYRVLIVDDNDASANTILWMMQLLGHEAKVAFDGPSALALAREFHPQVVLLDIGMPGMNGYEVCKAMRQDPAFKDTVFIAQTGWGQPEHLQRSKEAGFDHHLVKPVNMSVLRQLLHDMPLKHKTTG